MKHYVIEEIGSSSSDEEDKVETRTNQSIPLEDKSQLIQTLNSLSLPDAAHVTQSTSVPVKTIGEHTAYSTTVEDHNHVTKPANTDEDFTSLSDVCPDTSGDNSLDTLALNVTSNGPHSPDISTCDLVPPVSSIQFQTMWKQLEKNDDLLYKYMKVCGTTRSINLL